MGEERWGLLLKARGWWKLDGGTAIARSSEWDGVEDRVSLPVAPARKHNQFITYL